MDLTTATPVEIDTKLAEIQTAVYAAMDQRDAAWQRVELAANKYLGKTGYRAVKATTTEILEAVQEAAEFEGEDLAAMPVEQRLHARDGLALVEEQIKFEAAADRVAEIRATATPYEAEFTRRGGWTRAFLVDNANGHVHNTQHCSTCFPTTRFHWLVDYSGKTEAEIVADAGERACTVCYPTAPVEVLARPTKMFTPTEVEAQKARADRAAAKAKRDADRIAKAITPDGSELKVTDSYGHRESFRTERAATTWLVQSIGGHRRFGYKASPEAEQIVIEALAAKHGKTVEEAAADIEAKVKAWIRRNA